LALKLITPPKAVLYHSSRLVKHAFVFRQRKLVAETFQLPPTPIEEFTLDNGLRVVLSPDHAIPVVSIAVYYDVGSRNEKEGRPTSSNT
jgi:hypothetical protein